MGDKTQCVMRSGAVLCGWWSGGQPLPKYKLSCLFFTQRGPSFTDYPCKGHLKVKFSKCLIYLSKKTVLFTGNCKGGNLRHVE